MFQYYISLTNCHGGIKLKFNLNSLTSDLLTIYQSMFLCLQKLIAAHPHAVNCRDLDGRHSTPLHFAAGYNRVAVVEYLLQHGAEVHAKDKG